MFILLIADHPTDTEEGTPGVDRSAGASEAPEDHAGRQNAADRISEPPPVATGQYTGPGDRECQQEECERVFQNPGEEKRCNESVKETADGPAGSNPDIESGQILRRRSRPVEFSVTEHGGQEEGDEVQRVDQGNRTGGLNDQQQNEGDQGSGKDPHHQPLREQCPACEDQDEGEQIESQRYHPEKRNDGDIGGDVLRYPEQQARRQKGVPDPAQGRTGRPVGSNRSGR